RPCLKNSQRRFDLKQVAGRIEFKNELRKQFPVGLVLQLAEGRLQLLDGLAISWRQFALFRKDIFRLQQPRCDLGNTELIVPYECLVEGRVPELRQSLRDFGMVQSGQLVGGEIFGRPPLNKELVFPDRGLSKDLLLELTLLGRYSEHPGY